MVEPRCVPHAMGVASQSFDYPPTGLVNTPDPEVFPSPLQGRSSRASLPPTTALVPATIVALVTHSHER